MSHRTPESEARKARIADWYRKTILSVTVENIQKTVAEYLTLIPWKSRRRNNVACFPRPEPETAISGVERQLGTTLSGGESRMKQAAEWLQQGYQSPHDYLKGKSVRSFQGAAA
jgi:hypothetical protein